MKSGKALQVRVAGFSVLMIGSAPCKFGHVMSHGRVATCCLVTRVYMLLVLGVATSTGLAVPSAMSAMSQNLARWRHALGWVAGTTNGKELSTLKGKNLMMSLMR